MDNSKTFGEEEREPYEVDQEEGIEEVVEEGGFVEKAFILFHIDHTDKCEEGIYKVVKHGAPCSDARSERDYDECILEGAAVLEKVRQQLYYSRGADDAYH